MNDHGGHRPGAGRRPKALRFALQVAAAEQRIVLALPELLDLLLDAARRGDTSAMKYLVDRALGRVQTQAKPLAEDDRLPFDHPGAETVVEMKRRRELAKNLALTKSRDDAFMMEHAIVDAELAGIDGNERYEAEAQHMRRRTRERSASSLPSTPWQTPPEDPRTAEEPLQQLA